MTKIEWTNETWNPIIGCNKISEGCKNCYAEKMAFRLANMEWNDDHRELNYCNVIDPDTKKWNGKTHLVKEALTKPLNWKKPRMIFICSMGDLFHESVPFSWIMEVMDIIEDCPQHTFQILTKRPARMFQYFGSIEQAKKDGQKTLPNLWLGVTAENQEQANIRIPTLCKIPATKRFISCEPLLSDIDLECFSETGCPWEAIEDLDWVIAGGESGQHARPMHPDWVRSLRDQCQEAEVPFFFKGWGNYTHSIPDMYGHCVFHKVGKKKSGRLLDGKEYNEMPIN